MRVRKIIKVIIELFNSKVGTPGRERVRRGVFGFGETQRSLEPRLRSITRRSGKGGKAVLVSAFWIFVWQMAAMAVGMELLVPTPLAVAKVLLQKAVEPEFWQAVGLSMSRIVLGFCLGVLGGVVLAVVTRAWSLADALLAPLLRVIRATPVASFIILALLWIRSGLLPAFIAMLMVLPVIWANVYEGIGAVDPQLLEMTRVYRFGLLKQVKLLYVPALRPYFKAAAVTALGMAWKSGIAAEVLCQPKLAVGSGLYYSKLYLEIPELFAWTAVVIILSLLVEKVLVRLLRRV